MGGNQMRTSTPRLRDLGDHRQPVAGAVEVARASDIGELPYAVDDEVPAVDRGRTLRLALVGAVLLALAVGLGLALLA